MILSVNYITSRQYRKFIRDSDVLIARDYGALLTRYYGMNGLSWSKTDDFIHSIWQSSRGMMDSMMSGNRNSSAMMSPFSDSRRLVLLDGTGRIIVDTDNVKIGEIHPPEHWSNGVPLEWDNKIVGTVLYGSMIEPVLNPMDVDFLRSISWAILLSTTGTVLFALFVGFLFVSNLIKPLNRLSGAINKISEGESNIQVSVDGDDEISLLSKNFNKMSRKLYEARKWRTRLSADIAHEIRTPITTIQGELEAILDGLYPMDRENLRNIYKDTVVLAGIVEDLQLLDSLEVNSLLLDCDIHDVREIVREAVASFKTSAGDKGLTLHVNFADDLPSVYLDRRRIRQVLNNLISNALKYSSGPGEIIIDATSEEGELTLSVRDFGSGIGKEHLRHIFDRFYRIDESRSRSSGGTGLGLAICRTIVEAHGGEIYAESTPGIGTKVTFRLPIGKKGFPS